MSTIGDSRIEFLAESGPVIRVPHIRTARLLLREFRELDFDAFAENLTDPLSTQFIGGTADRRSAFRIFISGLGYWGLRGTGWWAVELEETHEFIGSVGAFYRERPCDLELGWTFVRKFWRRGFALEAARAALAFGEQKLGARRVIAHIDKANTASTKVAERLGMTDEGEIDFYGEPVGRWAIER